LPKGNFWLGNFGEFWQGNFGEAIVAGDLAGKFLRKGIFGGRIIPESVESPLNSKHPQSSSLFKQPLEPTLLSPEPGQQNTASVSLDRLKNLPSKCRTELSSVIYPCTKLAGKRQRRNSEKNSWEIVSSSLSDIGQLSWQDQYLSLLELVKLEITSDTTGFFSNVDVREMF